MESTTELLARAEKAELEQERWKKMYGSAIKCAQNASATSDHLRTLLVAAEADAAKWRALADERGDQLIVLAGRIAQSGSV